MASQSSTKPNDMNIPPKSTREVHELLRRLGVKKPKEVSCCLKRAILKGYIVLLPPEDDPKGRHNLDKELLIDSCPDCGKKLTCRVRDVLFQDDYPGAGCDPETASFFCDDPNCSMPIYISKMCYGKAHFEGIGKFHNHCTLCPHFGKCLAGHLMEHCEKCGHHFVGYACDRCGPSDEDGSSDEGRVPREECSVM